MNKKLNTDLLSTAELCTKIANGEPIAICKRELKYLPQYLDVKTKNAAKKHGLVLKRGAKPIGTCEWRLDVGGYARGDLYLGSSFKSDKEYKA